MFVGEEIESDQTLTFHRCFLPSRFEAALFQKEQAAADFGLPTSSHRGCRYVGKLVPSRGGVGWGENQEKTMWSTQYFLIFYKTSTLTIFMPLIINLKTMNLLVNEHSFDAYPLHISLDWQGQLLSKTSGRLGLVPPPLSQQKLLSFTPWSL